MPEPEIDPAQLDADALKVVARLTRHGYTAYLVGGCVRDLLLSAKPTDFDVATDATPEEIRGLFRNSRLIGRRFRLAHILFGPDRIVEVATFRGDPLAQSEETDEGEDEDTGSDSDSDFDTDVDEANGDEEADDDIESPRKRSASRANGAASREARSRRNGRDNGRGASRNGSRRGGDDLLVTDDNQYGTAEEDALRRDFTVNGLFYDIEEGRVIDYVGGREDLRRRVVRTIGDPNVRMQEDPVRGMRAARIAAKLDLTIEPATFAAMRRHADELPRCAPARVLEEILKILRTGASHPAFRLLRESGILKVLLPSIERVLVQGGDQAETAFYSRLEALDSLIRDGKKPSDAVLLATLLSFLPLQDAHRGRGKASPARKQAEGDVSANGSAESQRSPIEAQSDEAEADPLLPSADRVLAGMSAQARLPRRIADRVRLILSTQRVLRQPKRRGRRRGAGPVAAPHFADALLLLELMVRATDRDAEILERWKARAEQFAEAKARRAQEKAEETKAEESETDRARPRRRSSRRGGASPSESSAPKDTRPRTKAKADAKSSSTAEPTAKKGAESKDAGSKPSRPPRRRRKKQTSATGEKSAVNGDASAKTSEAEKQSKAAPQKKRRVSAQKQSTT